MTKLTLGYLGKLPFSVGRAQSCDLVLDNAQVSRLHASFHAVGDRIEIVDALPRDDNGTICSSAALGVFPYTPAESMAALKHFYRDLGPKIWGAYGFHDGFNATEKWYDEIYMGLNQAQIVVGIENHRTALVWQNFMKNQEIGTMLKAVGFTEDAPGK